MNELVVFTAALCHRPAGFRYLSCSGPITARCGDWFPQAVLVSGDAPLDDLGEVLPQMEPVRDLHGVRCTGAGSFDVGAGPVPGR
ncbi:MULTISPECIES: hypothetical protein [unclassified Actinoplanes]|uniref:hypothetical protein n=1 Tax=unclassified Actinoplanes TaxID=2626549 RepID=UPI001E4BF747|nr:MULTISPECIES: hypothetical protein [unclassified Actinoplanes]